MKIFENRSSAMAQSLQNNDNNAGRVVPDYNNNFIAEYPNELKIGTQLHDKTTLAPIFGGHHSYYSNGMDAMLMHNARTIAMQYVSSDGSPSNNFWAAWGNETALNFGNGQSRMAGKTHSRIWQSTYEPDKIYVCGLSYTYNHGYSYHYVYSVSQRKIILHARTDHLINNVEWFHETPDYIYGIHNGNYQYGAWPSLCRLEKTSLMIHRTAYHHRHGYIQPLYWDNDYVLYWHNFANWSSGRVAAALGKIRWDGILWTGTTFYWSDDYPTSNHQAYVGLQMHKNDGGATKSFIYGGNTMTDGLAMPGVNTSDNWSFHQALVYNNTLMNTHKIIRTYMIQRMTGGDWKIIRSNIPLHDHATAFTADAGNQGGTAMGTAERPRFDARLCTITGIGSLPSSITDTDVIGSGGKYYAGNTSHHYKANNLTFFEANGKGYLFWDCAKGNNYNNGSWNAAHVFRIKNYAASIQAAPNETQSLALEYIQKIEFGYNCWAIYRPEDHAKTFIAMSRSGGQNKIYTFNTSTQQFQTSNALVGEYSAIGNTAEGDIYAVVPENNYRWQVHSLSLSLPYKLEVTPSSERLEYTGSNLTPNVKVNAFNHVGDRVSITVNLQVIGLGATFTDAGATNGGKNISVTTSAGADTTVNLQLTDPSLVRITAAMSI